MGLVDRLRANFTYVKKSRPEAAIGERPICLVCLVSEGFRGGDIERHDQAFPIVVPALTN